MGDRPAVVVRAIAFEVEETAAVQVTSSPDLTGVSRVRVQLKELRVHRLGFLVQRLPDRVAEPVWEPVLELRSAGTEMLCRFREKIGDSEFYCARPSFTRAGYCWEHANSWKALYERCAQGEEEACDKVGGEVSEEFAVYALDYGGRRLKVGLTQLWRFQARVAEQPAVSATLIAAGTLADMRRLERELGRKKFATEGAGVSYEERLRSAADLQRTLSLREVARRLANMLAELGLQGSYEAVVLKPRELDPREFLERRATLEEMLGRRVKLSDYWAGILVFAVEGDGRLLLDKWDLLHHPLIASFL